MYHNPLGPTAATGISGIAGFSFTGSLWIALAIFTLIGASFALLRVMPRVALNRSYARKVQQAQSTDLPSRK